MYHSILGPSLRQRFDRSQLKLERGNSGDRFSSFQSPPPSDHQLEQFSDYDSPREKGIAKSRSKSKQRSYILVEQLPLQYGSSSCKKKSALKNNKAGPIAEPQKQVNKSVPQTKKNYDYRQLRDNGFGKYNYMQNVEKQLSIIKQDVREYLRESHHSQPLNPIISFPPILPFPNMIEGDYAMAYRIQLQEQRLKVQQLRLKNVFLDQQNIGLKERLYYLQMELRKKDEQKIRRETQFLAEKASMMTNEQQFNNTRKQVKQKLLQQIANLQARCQEMREEMNAYKLKQEQLFDKLFKQKEEEKSQNKALRFKTENHAKFVQVFINMIGKLPIRLQSNWSQKKKIAIGWKVVKHFVKKALKLGIPPPIIIGRQQIL